MRTSATLVPILLCCAALTAYGELPRVGLWSTQVVSTESGERTGVFSIFRWDGTEGPLRVNYTVSGTATPGVDYQPLRGFVTIKDGQQGVTFKVIAIDDGHIEPTETVTVAIQESLDYQLSWTSNMTVYVKDDDIPRISVVAVDPIASEAGDTARLVFHRAGDTNRNLTVYYNAGGTANNGVDYRTTVFEYLFGALTFRPGETTRSITIRPISDKEQESSETVTVTISPRMTTPIEYSYEAAEPHSATITIIP